MRGLSGHDFHKSVFSYRRKKMKKLFNLIGSVLLTSLLFTGFVFTSCEQTTETQAFQARLSTLNSVNPPEALNDWTPLADYAADGGGGGHSVYGGGVFLSANWNDGSLGYSTDGQSWSQVSSTATTFGSSFIKHLAFMNNTFWAVGQGGKIATSTDGQNWTAVTGTPLTGDIYGVDSDEDGNYIFVTDLVGGSSQIVLFDGTRWTLVSNPVSSYKIDSVAYSEEKFIIVCNVGWISYTTTDYTTWATPFQVKSDFGTNTNHFKMIAAGYAYDEASDESRPAVVAVSRYGLAYTFTDGNIDAPSWGWEDIYPSSSGGKWLNCVLYDGSKFIVGGQDGAMAYSDPTLSLANWTIDTKVVWTNGAFSGGAFINGIAYKSSRPTGYIATGGDSKPAAAYTKP
jgi:hypothetical protein